jgi:long-chain acyl-CoA synthetase
MHPRLHAQTYPHKSALTLSSAGNSITFAQLEARANRGAHALRLLGLNNDDAVAISCDNRLEFFDIYWAAQRAGLMLALLSARLKTDEIAHIVNDSGAKVLLISDAMSDTARHVLAHRAAMPGLEKIVTIGPVDNLADWNALCSTQVDTPIDDEQNGGRMVYSSGTTGRPKGLKFISASDSPVQTNPAAALFSAHYGFDANTV